MSAAADTQRRARPRRRFARGLVVFAILLMVLALLLRFALRPEFVTRMVLQRASAALGLQITAKGIGEYRLRGTPQLVLRQVDAREPGARTAVLRAERVLVAVPWSTLRARGASLQVTRIELDAPVLDLRALQAWQATRPPSKTQIPTLTRGIAVTRGRVVSGDWRIDDLGIDLPRLFPEHPVAAHLRGRYLAPPTTITFDVNAALTRPANDVGAAVIGSVALARDDWRLPATIRLSGPLHVGSDDPASGAGLALQIAPARLALSAAYAAGKTRVPFVLGLHGPVRFERATWTLAPVGIAVRGKDAVPNLDAHGAIAYGRRLVLRLQGALPEWRDAWPALPPPLGQSTSPLPFRLDYLGKPDASDPATLHLRRDQTRFDARFRLPAVLAWIDAPPGSPIPPLDGRLTTPRLELSGAQLEGVQVEMDDPDIQGTDNSAAR